MESGDGDFQGQCGLTVDSRSGHSSPSGAANILRVGGVGRKDCLSAWRLGPEDREDTSCRGSSPDLIKSILTLPAPVSYLVSSRPPPLPPEGQSGPHTQFGGGMGQDGAGHFCQVAEAPKDALPAEPCGFFFFYLRSSQRKEVWYTNGNSLQISYPPWQACLEHIQGVGLGFACHNFL